MMSASLRKGTAESKSQQLKLSMFHWFFVGLLPLILLVIFANIIDRNVLSSIISNLISMIPEEKVETDFVPNINNSPPNQMIVKVKSKMERQQTMMTSNSHGTSTTTSTRSSNNINQEENNSSTTKIKTSSSNTPTSTGKQDKAHTIDQNINQLRSDYRSDVNNMHKALNLADALRHRDLIKHDGGSLQKEAIKTYKKAIKLIIKERNRVLSSGGDIRLSKHGRFENTAEEMFFSNEDKSIQILLVSTYCSLGKQYFMANMFEKAVGAYDAALKLEEGYIDALNSRASASLILGKYHEAGSDYEKVLSLDQGNLLTEVFTGLTKVLIAKEEAVSSGWDTMIGLLNELIPSQEKMISNLQGDSSDEIRGRNMLSNRLKTMHLAMFSYHDHKTNNIEKAWYHLKTAHRFKMTTLPAYNTLLERKKMETLMQIFNFGFWPQGVGSSSQTPIFIIGFPRSGSTLLERVLDSHSQIAGTGEDSIFNGMLDEIRNGIVKASQQSPNALQTVVEHYANKVNKLNMERWQDTKQNNQKESEKREVLQRFVDKMLTNYVNVGFIHFLFPNALILHVIREPMDTLFSAFKHEFPPGSLDYTSEFTSLTHMYQNYRDVMDHWDKVLPGRVTHIKYEDMVNDMPGMAHAIISATTLQWEPDVLNFHKKKQAVNTMSTVQVRKGVYKDSVQSWKRYEDHLESLVEKVGPYVNHRFETTLKKF